MQHRELLSAAARAIGACALQMRLCMKYLALSYVLFATACATGDETVGDPMADPDPAQDPGQMQGIDQPDPAQPEPAPAGDSQPGAQAQAASGPDIVTTGSTTFRTQTSLVGTELLMNGGIDLASWGTASFWLSNSASFVTAELTVNPAPNAAFQYAVIASGKTYQTRELRVQRVFGSDALQAVTSAGAVDCGPLPSNQATPVTLSIDRTAATFDVLIGGASSACTDLPTKIAGPLKAFRIQDSGYQNYGGRITFSDLSLF
jgi:hypothetical protein